MRQSETFGLIETSQPYRIVRSDFPSGWRVDVAQPNSVKPLSAPEASVAAALADPVQSLPLRETVGSGDQVCIAFTHPTAPCPEHILVPALLHELEVAGVHDRDITLLCASGSRGRTDQRSYSGMSIQPSSSRSCSACLLPENRSDPLQLELSGDEA